MSRNRKSQYSPDNERLAWRLANQTCPPAAPGRTSNARGESSSTCLTKQAAATLTGAETEGGLVPTDDSIRTFSDLFKHLLEPKPKNGARCLLCASLEKACRETRACIEDDTPERATTGLPARWREMLLYAAAEHLDAGSDQTSRADPA